MRISRKSKNLLKTILSVVLAVGVVFGIATLINNISNKSDDGFVEVHPTFEVGGLTDYGKYEDTKLSIYTKESFKCQGLQVLLEFDSNVKYQAFFYDESDNFISCSPIYTEGAILDVPTNAIYGRLEVTPIWDADVEEEAKELNIFKVRKYAKQLTIKVNELQGELEFVYEEYLLDSMTFDSECYYTASAVRSTATNYKSYIFEATENCSFYVESDLNPAQYVILRTDGTSVRYQKADSTWVDGIENNFELNVGDKVYISINSSALSTDFHFYLGTNQIVK